MSAEDEDEADDYESRQRAERQKLRDAARKAPEDPAKWLELFRGLRWVKDTNEEKRTVLVTIARLLRANPERLDALTRAAQKQPESVECFALLAAIAEDAGNEKLAVELAYETTWFKERGVGNTSPEILDRLFDIRRRTDSWGARDISLEQIDHIRSWNPAKARAIADELLRSSPNVLRFLEERVACALRLPDIENARSLLTAFVSSIEAAPETLARGRFDSATRVSQLNLFRPGEAHERRAIQAGRKAIDADPLRVDLRVAYARALSRVDPEEGAYRALIAAAVATTVGVPWPAEPVLAAAKSDHPLLREMLDRVRADIRADPRSIGARKPDLFDPPSYRLRAEELCRAGLLGEALEMLGEYAEMLGKNAMPTSAAETFALMSSIAPDSKELALRAAAALLDVRKLDLALESAQRARRHDPADPRALHLLADIYTAKGDTKRAAAVRAQLV